jgi:hypothetical protein
MSVKPPGHVPVADCALHLAARLPPPVLLRPVQLKEEIAKYKVGAPARVGLLAPNDVTIPGGGTGMDPSQTQFFQVLGIATKINKGTIDIVSDVHLIKAGDKVSRAGTVCVGEDEGAMYSLREM